MNNRHEGRLSELVEGVLDRNPIRHFQQWLNEAIRDNVPEPEAMTLSTASAGGIPSARMVLLKKVDDRGFVFFTNYDSRKGRDLAENARAALVFFWPAQGRQVRVEGTVGKISAGESDMYFQSRERDHQLSSLASAQSEVTTREELERRYEELRVQYKGKIIPRPLHWGGYRVQPMRVEFWQRRFARLNDRIAYELGAGGQWSMKRLAP